MANSDISYQGQAVSRAQLAINRAEGVKYCYVCKETKPFEWFSKSKDRSDGKSPICRRCTQVYRNANAKRLRESQKKWRAKNRERFNDGTRRRYHADVEKSRAKEREKRKKNPEVSRGASRRFRLKNREKCNEASKLAKRRRRMLDKELGIVRSLLPKEREGKNRKERERRIENRAELNRRARERHKQKYASDPFYRVRLIENSKKYHNNNKPRIQANRRNRKARIRAAKGKHTAKDIQEIFHMQKGRCANPACRKKIKLNALHVDHIIAVANGGGNDRRNLQLMCRFCNQQKHSKDPIIWSRENGFLL